METYSSKCQSSNSEVLLKEQQRKFTGQSYQSAPEWHEGAALGLTISGVLKKEVLKEGIREQP